MVTQVKRATVKFFDGLTIDGYMMPDGEFRVGLSGVGRILGYSERWLRDSLTDKSPRTAKALRGLGFSENIQKVLTQSIQGNEYTDQTINLRDFNSCVIYAAKEGKAQAIALLKGLTDMALTDFFRDAFGLRVLSIDEKRDRLYKAFAETLTAEDWRTWDREDVAAIEEQQRFLSKR